MSRTPVDPDVALYIQRLKNFFAARTDEELASKLGMSKQNIGNWRSRGAVPASVIQRVYKDYAVPFPGSYLEDAKRVSNGLAQAGALNTVYRYIEALGREPTPDEWQRLGDSFTFLLGANRGYLREQQKGQAYRSSHDILVDLLSQEDGRGRYYPFLKRMMEDDLAIPQ